MFKVINPTQYHIDFIEYYKKYENYGVLISNDSIIIGKKNESAIIIPTDLPLNREVKHETINENTLYTLIVKRQNYTDIFFTITGIKNHKIVFERNNIAVLESSFHLGSEGFYEKNEDEIYAMNDYNINDKEDKKLLIPTGDIGIINYFETNNEKEILLLFKKKE
ncbi:hypothetical protein ACOSP6_00150 [Tenacibaculum sp. MEBiC06402]|uniref:hypothetical protein n=1 Tax=unclassified Tenacibaculum TaxID=2635139 RepID=UPI003B9AA5D6